METVVKSKGNTKIGIPSSQQTPHIQEIALLIESASRGDQKALRKIVSVCVALILLPISYVTLLRLRQGDRCLITGDYGLDASPDFYRGGGSQAATIVCHILPYSLNDFQETSRSVVISNYSFLFHKILMLFPRKTRSLGV